MLRMPGLLVTATAVVPLGMMELRDFQKWVISRWLDPKYNRQRHVLIYTSNSMPSLQKGSYWRASKRIPPTLVQHVTIRDGGGQVPLPCTEVLRLK
ncbi:uncharacterized [Tachysurus ichikawai]